MCLCFTQVINGIMQMVNNIVNSERENMKRNWYKLIIKVRTPEKRHKYNLRIIMRAYVAS